MGLLGRLMKARQVDNGTTNWWDIPPKTLAQMVVNAGGIPSAQRGTVALRPAAGSAGRVYYGTDSRFIYVDNGTDWEVYPPPGAVSAATEIDAGVAEIATQTEVNAGTDDARIVTPLKLASRTASDTRAGVASLSNSGTNVALAQNDPAFAGYMTGLSLRWDSATQLSVLPGAAWIESLGRVYNSNSTITKGGLSFPANSWVYVYYYDNSGVPDVQLVAEATANSAPASPYKGDARSRTADTSRRFLGVLRWNAAGTGMLKYIHKGNWVYYLDSIKAAPLLVLNNGRATTETSVSCVTAVPVVSTVSQFEMEHFHPGGTCVLGNPDDTFALSSTNFLHRLGYVYNVDNDSQTGSVILPLSSTQAFSYFFNGGTPVTTTGLYASVQGYQLLR